MSSHWSSQPRLTHQGSRDLPHRGGASSRLTATRCCTPALIPRPAPPTNRHWCPGSTGGRLDRRAARMCAGSRPWHACAVESTVLGHRPFEQCCLLAYTRMYIDPVWPLTSHTQTGSRVEGRPSTPDQVISPGQLCLKSWVGTTRGLACRAWGLRRVPLDLRAL